LGLGAASRGPRDGECLARRGRLVAGVGELRLVALLEGGVEALGICTIATGTPMSVALMARWVH
jgi:hypothetical protein